MSPVHWICSVYGLSEIALNILLFISVAMAAVVMFYTCANVAHNRGISWDSASGWAFVITVPFMGFYFLGAQLGEHISLFHLYLLTQAIMLIILLWICYIVYM